MPEYRTYYEILDIGFDADDATIKKAYRKAAASHHPDRVDLSERAQKRIRELNIARETLLNSELRQKYNYQLFKMGIISDDFVEENGNELDDLLDNTNFTAGSTNPEFSRAHHNQPTERENWAYDPSWDTSSQRNSASHEEWDELAGPVLYSSANFQAWKPKKRGNKLAKQSLYRVILPLAFTSGFLLTTLILWIGFRANIFGNWKSQYASKHVATNESGSPENEEGLNKNDKAEDGSGETYARTDNELSSEIETPINSLPNDDKSIEATKEPVDTSFDPPVPTVIEVIKPFTKSSRSGTVTVPEDTSKIEISLFRNGVSEYKDVGKGGVLSVNGQTVVQFLRSYTGGNPRRRYNLHRTFNGIDVNTRIPETLFGMFDITEFAKPGDKLNISYRHQLTSPAIGVKIRFTPASNPSLTVKPSTVSPNKHAATATAPSSPVTTESQKHLDQPFAELEFSTTPESRTLISGTSILSDDDLIWSTVPDELTGLSATGWDIHPEKTEIIITNSGSVVMVNPPRLDTESNITESEQELRKSDWLKLTEIDVLDNTLGMTSCWPVFVKEFKKGEKIPIGPNGKLPPILFLPHRSNTQQSQKIGFFDLFGDFKKRPDQFPSRWQNLPTGFRADAKANHITLSVPAAELINQESYTLIFNLTNVGKRTGKPTMNVKVPYTKDKSIDIKYYYGHSYNLTVSVPGAGTVSTRNHLGRHRLALHVDNTKITVRLDGNSIGTIPIKRTETLPSNPTPAIQFTPVAGSWMYYQIDELSVVTYPVRATDSKKALDDPDTFNSLPYKESSKLTSSGMAQAYQQAWADHLGLPVEFENSIGMKMRLIPPGQFKIGEQQDQMNFVKPYYLSICEVTQEQYKTVLKKNPSTFSVDSTDWKSNPVETVTFDDAVKFCQKLSKMPDEKRIRRIYRLPSELEWEQTCRAGSETLFSFGDDSSKLASYAWFSENSENKPHTIGLKKSNSWGIYDMHGNVAEWCRSSPDNVKLISNSSTIDAAIPFEGVIRGGNWSDSSENCQSSKKGDELLQTSDGRIGFRVALPIPDKFLKDSN